MYLAIVGVMHKKYFNLFNNKGGINIDKSDLILLGIACCFMLVIFIISYFLHKYLEQAIIFFPIFIGFFVVLVNLKTNFSSDGATIFYWVQLPLVVTLSVYSAGFLINDKFISKKVDD